MNINTKINIIFISLLLIGSIFVYSSSSFIGQIYYNNDMIFYIKQILASIAGMIISYLISLLRISFIKKQSRKIFNAILFLNLLPFLPTIKHPINGAMRWISLLGIVFQPSELLKFSYFLNISFIFYFYKDQIHYTLSLILFYFIITTIILINQSDFGLIIIFSCITFILLWHFLYNKKILLYCFISIITLIIILILIKPYRIFRLMTYLNPWDDPIGKGYQIIQSQIAINNSNIYGLGLSNSRQKNLFLPMPHTDFIFSIIVEEIGIAGSFLILFLLFKLSYLLIKSSEITQDTFNKYFLLSSGLLIIIQTSINIGASTALLPTKGIGLPFISYGMSSIISFSILIGLGLAIVKNQQE